MFGSVQHVGTSQVPLSQTNKQGNKVNRISLVNPVMEIISLRSGPIQQLKKLLQEKKTEDEKNEFYFYNIYRREMKKNSPWEI